MPVPPILHSFFHSAQRGADLVSRASSLRSSALPLRIFLYSLTTHPGALVALQALDGIGAGIYGVAVVAMCADLTRGKGRFNALSGVIATAVSVGGVIGPLGSGFLVQNLGFNAAFYVFAGIATIAALLFVLFMRETRLADHLVEDPSLKGTTP